MTVQSCAICDGNLTDKRRYGGVGLANGQNCPLCHRPICSFHLAVVRWRWRDSGQVDSAHICQECRRRYAHRHWDTLNRDWIT